MGIEPLRPVAEQPGALIGSEGRPVGDADGVFLSEAARFLQMPLERPAEPAKAVRRNVEEKMGVGSAAYDALTHPDEGDRDSVQAWPALRALHEGGMT